MHTIRCPVCNGCGAVEVGFGTGKLPDDEIGWAGEKESKQCPACLGTGMQTVLDPGDWTPQKEPHRTYRGTTAEWDP